jgi:hypothetical protein
MASGLRVRSAALETAVAAWNREDATSSLTLSLRESQPT